MQDFLLSQLRDFTRCIVLEHSSLLELCMYADLLVQLRARLAALTEAAETDSSDELKKSISQVVAQLDAAIEQFNREFADRQQD
jgi:hypothetical protein